VDDLHKAFIGAIVGLCGVIGILWRYYTGRLEKLSMNKDEALLAKDAETRKLLDKREAEIAEGHKKIEALYEASVKFMERMLGKLDGGES